MKRAIRNALRGLHLHFLPSERNDDQPHFWLPQHAAVLGIAIFLLFALSLFDERILTHSDQTASIASSDLVALANADRAKNGLPPLSEDPALAQVAVLKAGDMASKSYFAHVSPQGYSPWHFFDVAGYRYAYAGENLAVFFSDSEALENAWMNSPEHRANILNPHFTQIGIAAASGMYEGYQTVFVAQEFGAPSLAPAALAAAARPAAAAASGPVSFEKPNARGEVQGAYVDNSAQYRLATGSVILETSNYVALEAPAAGSAQAPLPGPPSPLPASKACQLVASPQAFLRAAYLFMAALIAAALLVETGAKLALPHPRAALYSALLFGSMGVLYFASLALFSQAVMIA